MAQQKWSTQGSATGIDKNWDVIFHDEFAAEYRGFSNIVQVELVA
jgi:hypothetical protein